jgi:hypothetical protein
MEIVINQILRLDDRYGQDAILLLELQQSIIVELVQIMLSILTTLDLSHAQVYRYEKLLHP